jgi:hypothetical protein
VKFTAAAGKFTVSEDGIHKKPYMGKVHRIYNQLLASHALGRVLQNLLERVHDGKKCTIVVQDRVHREY